MSHIRSRDTKPEIRLRKALFANGFRYRINVKSLPGSPDIVLPRYNTVIFVNGCFWHGHDGCRYYVVPRTNTEFWISKISRNRDRDRESAERLGAMGWKVLIVWECEIRGKNLDTFVPELADRIRK